VMREMKAHFCSTCGSPLQRREIEHKQRGICPSCGQIHYDQLKVGAGALIERDGCLLLIRRTHEPFRQQWNVPAGYVEIDEDPAHAVIREVHEETGLQVKIDGLVNVYFFDDDPRGNGILIAYQCSIVGGELTESAEGTSPTFFAQDQIPRELAGGGHRQAILAWQGHGKSG